MQYFCENRRRYSLQRNLRWRNYRKRDPGAGAILRLILGMLLAQSEPEWQQEKRTFRLYNPFGLWVLGRVLDYKITIIC